jgi:hypothetical protein
LVDHDKCKKGKEFGIDLQIGVKQYFGLFFKAMSILAG